MKKIKLIYKATPLVCLALMLAVTSLASFGAPLKTSVNQVQVSENKEQKEYKKVINVVVPELKIKTHNGFHVPEIDGYNFMTEPSVPMLPVKSFSLVIPKEAKIKNIKATFSEKENLRGKYDIFPVQKSIPISESDTASFTGKNSSIYSSSEQYPGKLFEYAGEGNLRDYRILSVNVYPLQYSPAEKKLAFYKNINIEVTYDSPIIKIGQAAEQDEFAQLVKKMVSNPEDVSALSVSAAETTSDLLPALGAEYVIITREDLESEFQALADHKIGRGLTAEIVTVDWITSNYSGADAQEQIRNFIKDAKAAWNTKWVLLGGDTNVVPVRKAYVDNMASMTEYVPTDLYYSDLDGNWNEDGDSLYGEMADVVDLYPDVFVGRAPVNTADEAQVFVSKTIVYEDNPSDYERSVLFMAEYLDVSTDSAATKDMIEDDSIPEYFSVTKLYESLGNLNRTNAIAEMNKGHGIINHNGHANYNILSIGSGALYNDDMDLLTNSPGNSIFYSMGCWSNAMDYDSIAERFVLNPDGGGTAYMGNSRNGWYIPTMPGYGPSDNYERAFFESLFSGDVNNIGETFADSKIAYIAPANLYENSYRYLQYALNLLGDPETKIWTASSSDTVLSVASTAPERVNENENFTIESEISNSGTETAINVTAEIALPAGLSLGDGETIEKTIGYLPGQESALVTWTVNADSIGTYNIAIEAISNNAETAGGAVSVEVITPDTTPPVVSLNSPGDNAVVGDNEDDFALFYTPSDDNSINKCGLTVNGVLAQEDYFIEEGENKFDFELAAGSYSWSVNCVDDSPSANIGESETREFTVEDLTPPTFGSIKIRDSYYNSEDGRKYINDVEPDLAFYAAEADHVAFSCNNVNFSDWIDYPSEQFYSSFNLETGAGCALGDGPKTVYVKFKDEAGNEGAYANDSAILDRVAPTVALSSPDNSSTVSEGIVSFEYTPDDVGSGISSCELIVDGDAVQTNSEIIRGSKNYFTRLMAIGNYTWNVSCSDKTSYISPNKGSGIERTLTIQDMMPPTISGVSSYDITETSAAIQWATNELSDSKVFYWKESGSELTAESQTKTLNHSITLNDLSSGIKYYYKVQSMDSAGNVAIDNNGGSYYTFTTIAPVKYMHIKSIDMSKTEIKTGTATKIRGWSTYATAVVEIVDADGHLAVDGATVSGHWSGLTSDSDQQLTDKNGEAAINSDLVKNANGTFTFTVDEITKDGWEYDSSASEETSDSISS